MVDKADEEEDDGDRRMLDNNRPFEAVDLVFTMLNSSPFDAIEDDAYLHDISRFNFKIGDGEVDQFYEIFDVNGDARITYREFATVLKKALNSKPN